MPSRLHTIRVCLFDAGGRRFALRLDTIKEIVPMAALSRPPAMPSMLEGFLNLRGTAVAVVRLAPLLGLPADPLQLHTPLIVLRDSWALLVNAVTGIAEASAGGLLPLGAADSFNGCVQGRLALTAPGGAVHLLSLERLLLEKERRIVSEFQAVEDARLGRLDQHPS